MSKNTSLSSLINYVSANSSGNVTIAAPSSGYALDVSGTGRFTGNLNVIFANTGGSIDNNAYLRLVNTGAATLNQSVDLVMRWQDGTYNGTGGISMIRESATARNGKLILQPIDSSGNNVSALTLASSGAATFSNSVTSSDAFISTDGTNTIRLQKAYFGGIDAIYQTGTNAFGIYLGGGVYTTAKLYITNGGNVGIGTTSPSEQLEMTARLIVGNAVTGKVATFGQNTATTDTYIRINNTSGNFDMGTAPSGHYFYGQGTLPLLFYTNATERMRITSSGNVGIGTTSPGKLLHLYASNDNASIRFTNTAAAKVWDLTPALPGVANAGFSIYNVSNNVVPLYVADNGIATLTSDDNSGARTTINNVLTITQTNGNAPYSGFGSAILFKGTTYNGSGAGSPGVRNWGRIGMYLNDSSVSNSGESMYFAVAPSDNSDTVNTAMTIRYDGNVGIGTASPAGKLLVQLPAYTNEDADANHAVFGSGTNGYGIRLGYSESGNSGYINVLKPGVAWSTLYIQSGTTVFNQAGVERFRIASNGDLYANSGAALFFGSSAATYLSASTSVMTFAVNNAERMRITSGGALLIGTTSANGKVNIAQDQSSNNQYLNFTGTQASYNQEWGFGIPTNTRDFRLYDYTAGLERMRITSSGFVLIGSTAADPVSANVAGIAFEGAYGSGKFSRNNNACIDGNRIGSDGELIRMYRGGTQVGNISVTGSSTSYNTSSDYRLKEDFKSINGLEIVNKIKVYDYKWKANDSRMDGVLAHELAEILPYAVQGEKDGDKMQSVDYSKIVPVLIQAVKDQQAQIEELKQLINK